MSKTGKKAQQQLALSKEAVRKQIIKLYERKQYKKGLKYAESILQLQPDHGEARSLKGLILSAIGNKEQALEEAKLGLRKDLSSYVCWHVLGLVHRSMQEYSQAIKCYRGALRYEPDNHQILRDLALLQIHVRDLDGFVETRRRLLKDKPTQKANWMAFSIAEQMRGNISRAIDIVTKYEDVSSDERSNTSDDPTKVYENSEFLLYKLSLLSEAGRNEDALTFLLANEKHIVDKDSLGSSKVDLLMKLGRAKEAEDIARAMVHVNPDNLQSHEALHRTLSLLPDESGKYTSEQVERLDALYEELSASLPRWCKAVRNLPLTFLPDGDKFAAKLEAYLKPALTKGVPALHSTIRPLYKDAAKSQRIGDTLNNFLTSLKASGRFPGDSKEAPPSALMWTLLVYAHHLNTLKRFNEALAVVDEGIAHTPTALELYMCKAKIYKSAGDIERAAYEMNQVRLLDLADRFLNTKSTKYFLRADKLKDAEETVMLFTKQDNGLTNLFDMQCMWYELEYGASCRRTGDLGMAIKKFLDVEKHFQQIAEDQLDFHTYCLRKMTLRSYVSLLRLEDNLLAHPKVLAALSSLVHCYVELNDRPKEVEQSVEGLSKKDLQKRKREEKKLAAREEARLAAQTPEQKEAERLLKVENPLAEATKHLQTLLRYHPQAPATHIAAFEVYLRKGKFLLALRAVKKLLALDASLPEAHLFRIRLYNTYFAVPLEQRNEVVTKIFELERASVLGEATGDNHAQLLSCAKVYAADPAKLSLPQRTAAAEALHSLDASCAVQAASFISSFEPSSNYTNFDAYHKAHALLLALGQQAEADSYRARLKNAFPLHRYFSGETSTAGAVAAAAATAADVDE